MAPVRPAGPASRRCRAPRSPPSRRGSVPRGTRPRSRGGVVSGGDRTEPSPALARRPRRSCSRRRRCEGPPPELPRAPARAAGSRADGRSAHPHATACDQGLRIDPGPSQTLNAPGLSCAAGVVFPMPTCPPADPSFRSRSQSCSSDSCWSALRSVRRPSRASATSSRPRVPCPTINCCASGGGGDPTGEPSSASCRRSRTSSAPGCRTSGRGTTSRRCRCSGTAPASYGRRARSTVP